MPHEVVSRVPGAAATTFLPQRTIDDSNELLAAIDASVGEFARPQRQYVLEDVNATGL